MSTKLWSLFLEDYVFAKPRQESVEGKLILFVECEEKMLRRAGLDDVAHARTRPAREVFDEIRRRHAIPR
jgi:hypothetical protein